MGLLGYADDGRIEIYSNTAEHALRGVALEHRNYLFLGLDAGGECAAVMYSLIGTARLNGQNPEAWLKEVLEKITDCLVNRAGELLPSNLVPKTPDSA